MPIGTKVALTILFATDAESVRDISAEAISPRVLSAAMPRRRLRAPQRD